MKICVHGDTLLAWVSAAKLAETGNNVVMRVDKANYTFEPAREPGLLPLLEQQQQAGRLQITALTEDLPRHINIHLIALDVVLEEIERLTAAILSNSDAKTDILFLVLSTLPVGSLDYLQDIANQKATHLDLRQRVHVVGLPVFGREGTALTDFAKPSMLLVSGDDSGMAVRQTLELMRPFVRQATHVMVVPHTTAELIKLGINAMLATRISFINEMAALAEKLGVDIELVREGLAADPRIGGDYLQPGCGFGGPSFSDDLLSYAKTMKEELDTSGLIDAVLAINESQREILFRKIWRFFHGRLQGLNIAIWGAAFKAGTASLENSVVHPLLEALWAQDCKTTVYDPMAGVSLHEMYGQQPLLTIAESAASAVKHADALVIVTAWDEFWNPDFELLKQNLKQAVVFDGRNIYEPDFMLEQGFRYFAIGRGEAI
ncbi:nucleotide sugar dehydrogenase [Agitococcus lubricus]|uniref:UDP-glucose 6-dehydrogenase n=1 Tax=Agitococcus lubricus TaxID=1077255 RepID=A0A2T5J088_9GAMM|nr:nucleotide sugar dehydrogenase [Agitococcus lubricus]PTQ89762.1 UDPglucose 6-dehydrogenase [Agitococcus lubricus]